MQLEQLAALVLVGVLLVGHGVAEVDAHRRVDRDGLQQRLERAQRPRPDRFAVVHAPGVDAVGADRHVEVVLPELRHGLEHLALAHHPPQQQPVLVVGHDLPAADLAAVVLGRDPPTATTSGREPRAERVAGGVGHAAGLSCQSNHCCAPPCARTCVGQRRGHAVGEAADEVARLRRQQGSGAAGERRRTPAVERAWRAWRRRPARRRRARCAGRAGVAEVDGSAMVGALPSCVRRGEPPGPARSGVSGVRPTVGPRRWRRRRKRPRLRPCPGSSAGTNRCPGVHPSGGSVPRRHEVASGHDDLGEIDDSGPVTGQPHWLRRVDLARLPHVRGSRRSWPPLVSGRRDPVADVLVGAPAVRQAPTSTAAPARDRPATGPTCRGPGRTVRADPRLDLPSYDTAPRWSTPQTSRSPRWSPTSGPRSSSTPPTRPAGSTGPLLAAIGRVESDHGRFGGSSLDAQGVGRPAMIGPRLDGRNGTSVVRDTDAGRLDHDRRYDRAVGPMQFLPSTWSAVAVDGDADGRRDVQDIDDAALGVGGLPVRRDRRPLHRGRAASRRCSLQPQPGLRRRRAGRRRACRRTERLHHRRHRTGTVLPSVAAPVPAGAPGDRPASRRRAHPRRRPRPTTRADRRPDQPGDLRRPPRADVSPGPRADHAAPTSEPVPEPHQRPDVRPDDPTPTRPHADPDPIPPRRPPAPGDPATRCPTCVADRRRRGPGDRHRLARLRRPAPGRLDGGRCSTASRPDRGAGRRRRPGDVRALAGPTRARRRVVTCRPATRVRGSVESRQHPGSDPESHRQCHRVRRTRPAHGRLRQSPQPSLRCSSG